MLTLLAQTTVALTLSLPADLPKRPDFVVRTRELHADYSSTARAEARIRVGRYVGIMALDWVTTQMNQPLGTSLLRGRNEVNPLPGMGSGAGRAVTMGLIAGGWTLLDRQLSRHGHHGMVKALRFILYSYMGAMLNHNLLAMHGVNSWSPDNLLPAQWLRSGAEYRDALERRKALATEYHNDAALTCSINQAHQRPGHASCGMR